MNKKIKIELPNLVDTERKTVIKELQHNVDMQLEILQDRLNQDILVDLEDINKILEDTKSIIYDCYSTPDFNTNIYRNFGVLSFEYQRLALKFETANAEGEIQVLNNKTNEFEEKIENYENDLKNHLGTLVGLFLTFTLIPTAITGITMINGKFILPFVGTLILFGMLMIVFIYVLNHAKINKNACYIITIMTCIVLVLWYIACFSNNDISFQETTQQIDSIESF